MGEWSLALACFLWVNTVLKPLSRGSPLGTMLRASDRWRGCMVRLGWSIPQVGHLCGAVGVGVVLPVVGQWWANPAACPPAIQTPHPLSSYSPPNKMPWRPLSGAAPRHPATEPDPPIPSTIHSSEGGPVLTLLAGWATASCADRPTQGGRAASLPRCRAAVLLPADQPSLVACFLVACCLASRFAAPLVSTGGSPSIAALRLGWPEGATPESCSVQQWTTPI